MIRAVFFTVVFLLLVASAQAERARQPTVQVHGRQEVIVNAPQVRLSDVAEIIASEFQHNDAAIALGKIVLASSPKPQQTLTLSASEILGTLRKAGVDFNQVGYALPRITSIRRASRALTEDELRAAIESHLRTLPGAETTVRRLIYDESVHVTPNKVRLEVRGVRHQTRGRVRVAMLAAVEGEDPIPFNVSADIDEFREIPVAARPVNRGSTINPDDVMFARMNVAQLPPDALREEEDIVGHEVRGSLGYGDVFRRRSLHIPPVIRAGSPVSIQFSSALLIATATGTALDSGGQDERIRVRNEASKKVFQARVVAPGLVEVNQ